MAYQLKTTGIAANCTTFIAVDPDTNTIKDFASSSVSADITKGANVTLGSQTWDGNTRSYWQIPSGTTDADFVKFGTNKPLWDINEAGPQRTILWIGEAAGGTVRVFGNTSSDYFSSINSATGGTTCPTFILASNTLSGTSAALSSGNKAIFGFSLIRSGSWVSYKALHNDTAYVKNTGALSGVNVSYSLTYLNRRNDNSTHQTDKTHAVIIFNTALTEAQWDSLRDDWFGTLLEAAGGDTTAPSLSSATVTSIAGTAATIGATTDEANGTFYGVVTVSGTAPTGVQVEAGQDNSGTAATYAGNVAVSTSGAKTLNATGLAYSTAYYAHLMHKDAADNRSTVISSTQFTTAADTTAPSLSGAIVVSITSSGATTKATTDEANGTFYSVVTVSGTAPTGVQVEAGQDNSWSAATYAGNVAVSSTGEKSITATGLASSTSYYAHMMHKDAADNRSTVVSSAQFTTSAGADTTPPSLSAATVTGIAGTAATMGATTSEANGTFYGVITTNSTPPTATQVENGQNSSGSAAVFATNIAISSTGAKTIAAGGLSQVTSYYAHMMHKDAAGNQSTVISTTQFTTLDTTNPTLSGTITASAITQTAYILTWPAASDNVSVTSYEVSSNAGANWTDVGNVLTTNITGKTANTTYDNRVRAKDAAGNLSSDITLNVTTLAYGVDLTNATTYTVKNNTGSPYATTEFKLSFYRQDTDAFVVNKTVTTNSSAILGIVRDAALSNSVVYDIKITDTATNEKGIFVATAGAV